MLDQQMAIKGQFQMYGNMSSVEKAMNKADLTAYKHYDNSSYTLVPGLQHSKQIESPIKNAAKAALQTNGPSSRMSKVASPYNGSNRAMAKEVRQSFDVDPKRHEKAQLLDSMGYNQGGIMKPVSPMGQLVD